MCIIAVSPSDKPIIDRETLLRCFDKNKDGAGFAYWNMKEGLWYVEKGFLTFEAFWTAYSARSFTVDDYVISHFRIGTSGLKDGGNTHPFPITDNMEDMRRENFKSETLLFHNGTIGKGEDNISDTMVHVRDVIYPLMRFKDLEPKMISIAEEMCKVCSNRWLITLGPDVYSWGTWNTSPEGWEFSNFGWEAPKVYPISNKSTYNSCYKSGGSVPSNPRSFYPNGGRAFQEYYLPDGSFDSEMWRKDLMNNNNKVYDNKKEDDNKEEDFVYGFMSDDNSIVLWDAADEKEKTGVGAEYLFCPECYEDKHLMESPYVSYGDTLCQTCGSIFWDASGDIVTYDEEIRKTYLAKRAEEETKRATGSV